MPRVVVVCQTGRGTGFGRIASGIATALCPSFEVHVVGLGAAAPGEPWTGREHDVRFDPARTDAASAAAEALRPAAVLLVGAADLSGWHLTLLRRGGFRGATIAYVPVEGEIVDPAPLERLEQATALVTFTEVGASLLAAGMAAATGRGQPPDVAVIPHAIDRPQPPPGDSAVSGMRAELLPGVEGSVEGPWILNANRNDGRKRPELTLRAFAPVAERFPAARLVLHCQVRRPGFDLRIERARLRLEDRVSFTEERAPWPWPQERLSRLFASCEIGVNSTTAEAWGLVAFEHALHGAAQAMPRHLGLEEIWGGAPAWVPVGEGVRVDTIFAGREPDVEALTATLLDLVGDPGRARRVGGACQRRAREPQISWDAVGASWREVVEAAIQNSKATGR